MPYRRRPVTRRRRPTRRVAKTTKKYVKSAIRSAVTKDFHYFDYFQTDVQVNSYATALLSALIPTTVGDTMQSRDGKKIQISSFAINVSGYRNPASTTHDRMRIALVQVKRAKTNSGTDFNYNDIYDTSVLSVQQGPSAMRKIRDGAIGNFKVLKQWNLDLGFGTTDKSTFNRSYFKRFKTPLTVWYDTDAMASPLQNNLILVACSDTSASQPWVNFQYRMKFIP